MTDAERGTDLPPSEAIPDDALIAALCAGAIAGGTFTHREHLRGAWLVLRDGDLAAAMTRFREAIRRFATSQGAPEIYHETITFGFLMLVHERLTVSEPPTSFDALLQRHPELMEWRALLGRYWTDETLWSDRARATFVMPDRLAI